MGLVGDLDLAVRNGSIIGDSRPGNLRSMVPATIQQERHRRVTAASRQATTGQPPSGLPGWADDGSSGSDEERSICPGPVGAGKPSGARRVISLDGNESST